MEDEEIDEDKEDRDEGEEGRDKDWDKMKIKNDRYVGDDYDASVFVSRDFLRLGHPLHCSAVEIYKERDQEETKDAVDGGNMEEEETPKRKGTTYSSSPTLSDLHKDSLLADFTETRIASGNYFHSSKSRTSSTNSSLSGGEGIDELPRKRDRANSKFYTESPNSSFNSDSVDGRQMSPEQSVEDTSDSDDVPTMSARTVSVENPSMVVSPTFSSSDALVDGATVESDSSSSRHVTSDAPEDSGTFSEIASRRGGGPIPLSRIKCLVSMTTPRDMHLCGTTSLPGFVEFNMISDGFGCLFFPSISPHVPQGKANEILLGSRLGRSGKS